jgi:hypothetical protein
MQKFPERTRESDSKALLVVQALQRSRNASQNYMVTVVTTDLDRCFVSLSGSTRQQVENELRTNLHWIGQLNTTGTAKKPLRRALTQLEQRVGDRYAGAHNSATAFHPLRGALVDADRNQLIARARQGQPLTFAGNRDCAEPKALHAAAMAGAKITGMTTVWYGNEPNGYPDPAGPILHGVQAQYARPCDFCQQNEARIMMEVDRTYLAQKGVPSRSYEV